jgi:hypothetical protein
MMTGGSGGGATWGSTGGFVALLRRASKLVVAHALSVKTRQEVNKIRVDI